MVWGFRQSSATWMGGQSDSNAIGKSLSSRLVHSVPAGGHTLPKQGPSRRLRSIATSLQTCLLPKVLQAHPQHGEALHSKNASKHKQVHGGVLPVPGKGHSKERQRRGALK